MAYLVENPKSPFWAAQWTGADGKKKRRSTRVRIKPDYRKDGFRETPAQARARAQSIADAFERADQGNATAQKLHATINGLLPDGGVPSVEKYLRDYLATRLLQKPATYDNIERGINLFLEYLGDRAALPLDSVTVATVNAWLEKEGQRVRTSTLRLYRDVVNTPFRRAFEEELLARNPFTLAHLPQVVEASPIVIRSFTLADLREVVAALSPEWAMAVRLCVFLGGLRLGDVCNLRWDQFDLKKGVCELVTRKRGVPMDIPLIPSLVRHLKAWRRRGAYVLPEFHRRYNSKSRGSLSTEFSAMTRALGIAKKTGEESDRVDAHGRTDLTFHSLRSTAATILQEAGVPEGIAMKILSHNSAAVHRVYVRPSAESIRAGMGHLDGIDL